MKSPTKTEIVNGVNVEELSKTIDSVRDNPSIAKFKFQATNEWLEGGHCRTTIRKFHGANQDFDHKKTFVLDADEPPILLGQDQAANPTEVLLNAIVSCLTTSLVYHAAGKGIQIDEIESTIEGDLDLQGFLGMRDDVRPGYQGIRVNFKIKADVPEDQFEELYKLGPTYSPVFNSVTKGVAIAVTAQRMK